MATDLMRWLVEPFPSDPRRCMSRTTTSGPPSPALALGCAGGPADTRHPGDFLRHTLEQANARMDSGRLSLRSGRSAGPIRALIVSEWGMVCRRDA
jgi:hypothetical protein